MRPRYRHGAAIGFIEKVRSLARLGVVEAEYLVGDVADLDASRRIDDGGSELPGVRGAARGLRRARKNLVGLHETDTTVAGARGDLEADHQIGDHERVEKEDRADGMVLVRPIDLRARDAVERREQIGPFVSYRKDMRRGAFLDGQVELDARPIEVAGVVELVGALAHFFERAAGEAREVGGAQKTMLGDMADDVGVAVGELDRAGRALGALAANDGGFRDGRHGEIIPRGSSINNCR